MDDQFVKNASYCLGLNVGSNLAQQNLDKIDVAEFAEGLKDIFDKKNPRFSAEEVNQTLQTYIQRISEEAYKGIKEEGEQFLAENAKREEVTVLPSGLQYEVLKEGNGQKPSETSQVTVHYTGTLINGTVFDSSYNRNEPATFGLNQVIKGWTEGLQQMAEGAKYKLFIPQELAYGTNPAPNSPIKPYMALVFEVELLEIA